MRNAILVTLLASTLGLGATAAQADNHDSGKKGQGHAKHEGGKHQSKKSGKRGGNMMKRMTEKLSLTEDQQAQIKTLRESQKELSQALRAEKKALYTEIKALDTTSADYDSEVAALADKKAMVDRKAFIQRSTARQQFEAVLTAEQRVTMKEMKESRKNRTSKGKRSGKRGMMKGGLAEKLNLTDAQKDQITALRAAKKGQSTSSEFEAILTAEQLVTLNKMKENFKKRSGKHGQKHNAK
ncbi:Spy/CpxP family protein refolding chaperone [Leucothrix arctica]|uniref:Zinc resistance-associated protein n=1 Tax=Leucothrix arctica TaxID=1481894 RepID=A0A317CDH7_9GAMM|nr:Spy/CpxP family protein refolding chaperone [Leucothrix arctica]PWQ96161.1 hypothetical protein DKT75_09190 [Leucothrix arctica]